jgi:hypothetical protein
MATAKQLALRMKYAKTSVITLTKKLSSAKAKAKVLEAELKKAKATEKKKAPKPAARNKTPMRKGCRM